MRLEPLGDNIIIELDEIKKSKEKKLDSGLIIPAANVSDQEARQDMATVVAVGEGRMINSGKIIPLRVKPGDRVLFNKYAGTQLVKDEKTFLIFIVLHKKALNYCAKETKVTQKRSFGAPIAICYNRCIGNGSQYIERFYGGNDDGRKMR